MSDTMNTVSDKDTAGTSMKLDASVRLIEPKNNLLAVASVTFDDCFVVKGIKVVAGEKGLFVDMPSAQDASGNYHDLAHPITGAFRERLNSAVMDGYNAALEKNHTIGKAQREFADKPPIADRLAAGKAKADEHNAARPPADTPRRAGTELS